MKKSSSGFSLIEALIVVSVLGIVGFILTELLFRTFTGGNKTKSLSDIRQNGQTALNIIDQTARSADEIVCAEQTTLAVAKNGLLTRFRFYLEDSKNGKSGFIAYDNPKQETDQNLCDYQNLQTNITVLTASEQNGVSLKNGLFDVIKKPGFKDLVTVRFTLGVRDSEVEFKTSVQLR